MLDHLAADRARVANLEAQILHLENTISTLKVERNLAQKRLDSYHYPVLSLPNEVTSEVFMHFLPDYPLRPPLTGIHSPTVLTHVCRRWREIAVGTPGLWSVISLTSSVIPFELQVEIFDLWLSRSRSCPLSIDIVYYGPEVSVAIVRVFQEASRLEDLELDVFACDLPPTSVDVQLPLLRHLDLSLENPEPDRDIMLFHHAPQLRTAVLNDSACMSIQLPWAQLTSVTFGPVYPHECVLVLQQTSNLLYCDLALLLGGSSDLIQLKLLRLETLILRESEFPVVGYLDSLVLPALRSLSIPELFLGTNSIDALTSFVVKSGCRLEELRITGRIETVQIYRQAFPSIRMLSFHGWRSLGRTYTASDDSDAESETQSISECDELAG
ncbi:hypothetical protein B0H16DRAFT_1714381 [Mycena metata]|uniref:F-box domain-containing protein n=1 Tax=Mycena metata TaxID=1033252 RepID=A0AAD7JUQ6_9AGAR|nr:hypothetical protein B0H16DRAFT_1714381 [Mycena metata]